MNKTVVNTDKAPAAIGPYSQGIIAEAAQMIFVSGQLPIDPATGEFAGQDIASQAKQSLENLSAVLEEAGICLQHVVKTTVFLKDMEDFAGMNEVYSSYFQENPPARSAVQAARLPKDALVEIEAIAIR